MYLYCKNAGCIVISSFPITTKIRLMITPRFCFLFIFLLPVLTIRVYAQIAIDVELVAGGFDEPVAVVNAGDERLFVVERTGRIKILYPDATVSTFLDIDLRVGSVGGEQGLLGLAFHPDYNTNGY